VSWAAIVIPPFLDVEKPSYATAKKQTDGTTEVKTKQEVCEG